MSGDPEEPVIEEENVKENVKDDLNIADFPKNSDIHEEVIKLLFDAASGISDGSITCKFLNSLMYKLYIYNFNLEEEELKNEFHKKLVELKGLQQDYVELNELVEKIRKTYETDIQNTEVYKRLILELGYKISTKGLRNKMVIIHT